MIVYFGRDDVGCFIDHENGTREYVNPDMWMEFIRAASVPAPVKGGASAKLKVVTHVVVDKFDGEVTEIEGDLTAHPAHVERVDLGDKVQIVEFT